jgi:hypothetical protein
MIETDYDYEIKFTDSDGFVGLIRGKEQLDLEVSSTELGHILLASSDHHDAFVEKYHVADPFPILVSELKDKLEQYNLKVSTYFSKYRLNVE